MIYSLIKVDMYTDIGPRIKSIRETKNLSQRRFGKKIGLSAKTISAYETGRIIPSYSVLEKISQTYDVTVVNFSRSKRLELNNKINQIEELLIEIKLNLDSRGLN